VTPPGTTVATTVAKAQQEKENIKQDVERIWQEKLVALQLQHAEELEKVVKSSLSPNTSYTYIESL